MPEPYVPPHEVSAYPFHKRYPEMPDLFHLRCATHPDFGACVGAEEMGDVVAAHLGGTR